MRASRYLEIIQNREAQPALRKRATEDLRKFLVRAGFFLEVTTRPGILPPEKRMNVMEELASGNYFMPEVKALKQLYAFGFGEDSVTYRMFFVQFAPAERGMMMRGMDLETTRGGATRGLTNHRNRRVISIEETNQFCFLRSLKKSSV